jgi:hypothetical protein
MVRWTFTSLLTHRKGMAASGRKVIRGRIIESICQLRVR